MGTVKGISLKQLVFNNYFSLLSPILATVFILANNNTFVSSTWTDFQIGNHTVTLDNNTGPLDNVEVRHNFNITNANNTNANITSFNESKGANLTCQSSKSFQFCTWKDNETECKFEWNRVIDIFLQLYI